MSQLIVDRKYAAMISNRLRNVQFKGSGSVILSFSHSCEREDSRKRRGYFLIHTGKVFLRCHHCGVSCSLGTFLKDLDPNLAAEYRMELFKEGVFGTRAIQEPTTKIEPTAPRTTTLDGLTNFRDLARTNPARLYLDRRAIPEDKIGLFYLAPKFYSWASQYEPVVKRFKTDVPRLILPVYDAQRSLLGFSCRAFGKEAPKYIQLRLNKSAEFIFGLDRIDPTQPVIAVEGQIDSLFLDNAIAVGSANYNIEYVNQNRDRVIIVPDNDFRRNRQVCEQLKSAVLRGAAMSLLPANWHKDINDIIKKDGVDKATLMRHILGNRKSGAEALLELTLERRC